MSATETVSLPPHVRSAAVRANTFNADANTIDIRFTTGADVLRSDYFEGTYIERLLCDPENVRLGRLNAGASFLDTHNSWELDAVIGSVVPGTARMQDGGGDCTIQLSKSARAADTVTDIRDGVIRNISVGYVIHAFTRTEPTDGSPALMIATDWEPVEISAVPVPADPGAQVRAATRTAAGVRMTPCIVTRAQSTPNKEASMADDSKAADKAAAPTPPAPASAATDPKPSATDAGGADASKATDPVKVHDTPAGTAVVTPKGVEITDPGDALPVSVQRKLDDMVAKAVSGERERINEIRAMSRKHGLDTLGADHAERGTSVQRFKDVVLDELAKRFEAGGPATGLRAEPSLERPKENANALVERARGLGLGLVKKGA